MIKEDFPSVRSEYKKHELHVAHQVLDDKNPND